MNRPFLIDTSIWIDLYEDRVGFQGEPLGEYALKLFAMIKAQQQTIILTDLLMIELETNYSIAEINGMIKPFELRVKKIIVTKKQREEAKIIAAKRNVPPGDVLHAIIAKEHDAILVTRDNHFKQLTDISPHYNPEELI